MNQSAFESGRRARLSGCHRVLANPASAEELREWQSGWDTQNQQMRSLSVGFRVVWDVLSARRLVNELHPH